jgi:CTP synthase
MQMAVIEFARNVLNFKDANSTEMDSKTTYPVIALMDEQKDVTEKGGTMRLGAWACDLKMGSLAQKIYKANTIEERHRHRYEFNNKYKEQIEASGMLATGLNPETGLVEIIEIPEHPWFVGVQYHPEYKSTVANPHPLFVAFVKAALKHKKNNKSVTMAQK